MKAVFGPQIRVVADGNVMRTTPLNSLARLRVERSRNPNSVQFLERYCPRRALLQSTFDLNLSLVIFDDRLSNG